MGGYRGEKGIARKKELLRKRGLCLKIHNFLLILNILLNKYYTIA